MTKDAVKDAGAPCDPAPRHQRDRRNRKRSEQVAQQIMENIVRRGQATGDKLPLETEMLSEYQVSRSSLREALRLLEVQGLITIRPGPGRGTVIGGVSSANLAGTLALYLMMANVNLRQLMDAWRMVEPILAQLAAENSDRPRVAQLMAPFVTNAAHDDRAIGSGLAFHDTVAELADNPVLALILGAVGFLVTEQVRVCVPGFKLSDATIHAHEDIADAILAGDGPAAAAAMLHHQEMVTREIEEVMPDQDRDILVRR